MSIAAFVALSIFLLLAVGRPMLRFIQDPGGFRAWVDGHGVWGRIAFVGMMFFQVVVAIIPGEPLEIAAGYAFGFWEGTLLCQIGIFLGSLTVFLFVRNWGIRVVEVFFPGKDPILQIAKGSEKTGRPDLYPDVHPRHPQRYPHLLRRAYGYALGYLAANQHHRPHPIGGHLYHRRKRFGLAGLLVCLGGIWRYPGLELGRVAPVPPDG